MLSYILAIAVGLGSLSLYLAIFLKPHIHRKDDLVLSGLGLFYALVLWTCGGRITGAVLLGQLAVVALLSWFLWETVSLRGVFSKPDEETVISPGTKAKIKEISLENLFNKIAINFKKKPFISSAPASSIAVETEVETEGETETETKIEPKIESVSFQELETVIEVNQELVKDTISPVENQEKIVTIKEITEDSFEDEDETEIEVKQEVKPIINVEDKKGFSFDKLISGISGIFSKKKGKIETTSVVSETEETENLVLEEKDQEIVTEGEDQVTLVEEVEDLEKLEVIEVKEVEIIENSSENGVIERENVPPEIKEISEELTELQEANIEENISLENLEETVIESKEEIIIVEESNEVLSEEKEVIKEGEEREIKIEDIKEDQAIIEPQKSAENEPDIKG